MNFENYWYTSTERHLKNVVSNVQDLQCTLKKLLLSSNRLPYYRCIFRLIHLPHSWDDPGLGCNPNTVRSSLLASACNNRPTSYACGIEVRSLKYGIKRKKFHVLNSWMFFLMAVGFFPGA
jgi:hypothetical protein